MNRVTYFLCGYGRVCAVGMMLSAVVTVGPVGFVARAAEPGGAEVAGDVAQGVDAAEAAFLEKYGKSLETPGPVAAKDFVPAEMMGGTLFLVRPEADNDGLQNTYYIDTHGGTIPVTGTPALLQRIREIYALNYLQGVSKTDEFGKALEKAGAEKLQSVGNAVADPVGTVKNIPKGASRFFGRIGEGLKSVGKKNGDAGGAVRKVTGVEKERVRLALELGVDPYSRNAELQKALTEVAQAKAGGGLALSLGTAMVGGGIGAALTVVNTNQTLQETLVNTAPEDLRALNRKKLTGMGVSQRLADEFLMHPWYSPLQTMMMVDAFSQIHASPSLFLTHAVQALTAEDGFYFQRLALILAHYNSVGHPLVAYRFDCGVMTALDAEGTLVVPVSLDYGLWAERAARRAEEFAAMDHEGGTIKGFALWTDGALSPRLCEELKKRGIAFHVNALDGMAGPKLARPGE